MLLRKVYKMFSPSLSRSSHRRETWDGGRQRIVCPSFQSDQKKISLLMTSQNLSLVCQFHQHFMTSFFVQKCFAQLFSSWLCHFLAQKMLEKCWWNWLQASSIIYITDHGFRGEGYQKFCDESTDEGISTVLKKHENGDRKWSV